MNKKMSFLILAIVLSLSLFAHNKINSTNNVIQQEIETEVELNGNKVIYLAGGCFWGTEKYFSLINGVVSTEVGYANGTTENPSYEDVIYKNTGHAETVKVIYNPEKLTLEDLLGFYYRVIDPISINKQGNDVGTQYRTGIYYVDEDDKEVIEESLAELQKEYSEKLAVESLELYNYYAAEEYHQEYLDKNPNGYCHIGQDEFDELLKIQK